MTKKRDDTKIEKVKGSTQAKQVEDTQAVDSVGAVRGATQVEGTSGVGAIGKRRLTREMTMAERQQLFKIINEEAEKVLGAAGLPKKQRDLVAGAVKMAIDSGIVEDKEEK